MDCALKFELGEVNRRLAHGLYDRAAVHLLKVLQPEDCLEVVREIKTSPEVLFACHERITLVRKADFNDRIRATTIGQRPRREFYHCHGGLGDVGTQSDGANHVRPELLTRSRLEQVEGHRLKIVRGKAVKSQ